MAAFDELQHMLLAAASRLRWARLLRAVSRTLLVGATASCLVLGAGRVWPLPGAGWVAGGIAFVAAVTGAVIGLRPRLGTMAAALHLDRTAGLQERLSTAAVCLGRADGPAREVLRDAAAQLRRIDLRRDCPVALPRDAPALFAVVLCAVALAGLPGAKREQPVARIVQSELDQILKAIGEAQAGAPASARPSLEALKQRLAGPPTPAEAATRLAAALAQVDAKMRQLQALSDLARAALPPEARPAIEDADEHTLREGAHKVGERIEKQQISPEQRIVLQNALEAAIGRAEDADVKRALRQALDALGRNDGRQAAEALEQVMLKLAAEVRLRELEKLHEQLAQAKRQVEALAGVLENGVIRGTQSGDGKGTEPGTRPTPKGVESAFWQDLPAASARAEGLVASGAVPEGRRELVRRYFARPTE